MGLNDILAGGGNSKNQKEKTVKTISKKATQHTFSIRHDISTKVLLNKIQRVKELTTPNAKNISQGSIVAEALKLLADEMNFNKLEKKYSDFLEHITEENFLHKKL